MRRVVLLVLLAGLVFPTGTLAEAVPEVPAKGLVTLVDIGAKACIPCKLMLPVLASTENAYRGRVAVIFIDVWEHREQGERFGVRLIPTQIFFDKTGTEVYRHEGFLDKDAITARLDRLLAE